MYPIADLTAFCKRTTGDVPPKLVGASTTVVGSKMYLYGGRLVAERRMVSDIYVFDLESFKWEKLHQSSEDDIPQARYFHSADTWNNHLIVFGGMAIQPQSDNPEDLCVLNDVRLFDLASRHWVPAPATFGEASSPLVPKARYAHLSSVTANRLFIIGGQDLNNVWLDDIHVYDLVSKRWVQRREYPRHCGTYRSVAVTSDKRVRLPSEEGRGAHSNLGAPGTRFRTDKNDPPSSDVTSPENLIHLPYSAAPTEEHPCDIYLFSNYNFTDVQRELEVFSPLPDSDFSITDRSAAMTGTSFPPGLRFPTGAILGSNFIIAGTYLSQTFQSFSVWTLDLVTMQWSRIDPGSALVGSWFRSCLWPEANKFLIFGNRNGNLVEDYNRRLLSWDHVAVIDLEAFGIYQPPPLLLDIPMQEMGLAALEECVLADFEIVCDDGRKVQCSRKVLEDRWPWFKEQRRLFIQAATRALEAIPQPGMNSDGLPALPTTSDPQQPQPDPRLTPRSFSLSEPYPITLAFIQYLYSMSLITPLQHAPAVLSQLLLISSTYELQHLQSLVKHAMHRALTFSTSVGIYGVSTLCNCRSLQIRALRVVMAYSQKRPAGGRRGGGDGDGPGGGNGRPQTGPPGDGSRGSRPGAGGHPGSDKQSPAAARPRGMSDASYMTGPGDMLTKMSADAMAAQLSQLSISTDVNNHGLSSTLSSGKSMNGKSPMSSSKSPKMRSANMHDDNESPIEGSPLSPIFGYPYIPDKGKGKEYIPDSRPTSPAVSPVPRINEPRLPKLDMSSLPPRPPVPIVREPVSTRSLQAAMNEVESPLNMPPISAVQSQAPKLPVPLFLQRRLSTRPGPRESILSLSSEQELQSFAEIMNMSVRDDGSISEKQESFGIPLDDEDAIIDDILSFEDVLQAGDRIKPQGRLQHRLSYGSSTSSNYGGSTRHNTGSPAPPSDYEHGEFLDAYLSPNQSFANGLHLHNLPRRPFQGSDSDTPSLRSSASTSSMSSPTLSRPPSFQHFYPASPMSTTSSIMTPVDPISGGMHGLGVIQERSHSEDVDGYHLTPRDSDMKKPPVPVRNIYEEEVEQHHQSQTAPSSWNYRRPQVGQVHPSQGYTSQVHPSQVHPSSQNHPSQNHSNQMRSNQMHPDQMHSNQMHSNQMYSNQQHSNQMHSNQMQPNSHYSHQPHYYQHSIPEDRELREVRSYPDFDQARRRAGSPETIIGQPISAYNSSHNSMSSMNSMGSMGSVNSSNSNGSSRMYHQQQYAVPREREPHQYYQHHHRDSQVSQWSQSSSQGSENTQQQQHPPPPSIISRKASTPSLHSKSDANGGSAFSRLFKAKKTSTPTLSSSGSSDTRSVNTAQPLASPNSPHSSNSDVSLNKSDLKKMKKDAAKARRERLAIDLKERQEAREKAAAEAKVAAKAAKPLEAGMWSGLAVNTVL